MLEIDRDSDSDTNSGLDGEQNCSLCGVMIHCFDVATWSHNPLDILEESELQIYRPNGLVPGHILAPSSKIENARFSKFPWLSNCYFRAVTLVPSSDPQGLKCHLTGITLMDEPSILYAPRDKNIALICGQLHSVKKDNLQFSTFRPSRMSYSKAQPVGTGERIGYLFHAHCWEVLCHIQGKEIVEKRLPDLLRAVKKFWNDYFVITIRNEMHRVTKKTRWPLWGLLDYDVQDWVRDEDKAIHAKYEWYVPGCDIYISPWTVPEVQGAIDSSWAQKKVLKKQNLSRFPYECWLQILELLCPIQYTQLDVQNLRSFLSALDLDAPDSFWKSRLQLHGDILLELLYLENDGSLDWQSMCLDLMDLLSNDKWFISSGLATRKFALPKIRGILANFVTILQD